MAGGGHKSGPGRPGFPGDAVRPRTYCFNYHLITIVLAEERSAE